MPQSSVAVEFWKQLAALKLNILRLSEDAVPITGVLILNLTEPVPWCVRRPSLVTSMSTVLTAVGHKQLPNPCSCSAVQCSSGKASNMHMSQAATAAP